MKQFLVLYNAASGSDRAGLGSIKAVLPNSLYLEITEPNIATLVKQPTYKNHTIVAAGGDGTVHFVANLIKDTGHTVAVLPMGTLNHFAKDIGMPLDLAQAAKVIMAGHTVLIDAGTVNGRVFINNSSIGLYPRSLRVREIYEPTIGKWPAALVGVLRAALRPRHYTLQLTVHGKTMTKRTPFVLVGNNPYTLEPLGFAGRKQLTTGNLGIYIITQQNNWQLFRLFLKTLVGTPRVDKGFEAYLASTCTIKSNTARLQVAADGEIMTLRSPLHFEIKPKALRIVVPRNSDT